MALARPPPSLPGPGVTSVKTASERPPKPSMSSISRIQPSTKAPSAVKSGADDLQRPVRRAGAAAHAAPGRMAGGRRGVVGSVVHAQLRSLQLDPRDQEARQDEHREGDEEQDAAERDQRVELQVRRPR